MIAFKMKITDVLRGITRQVYLVVEFTNAHVRPAAKVEEPLDEHYSINDIRRLSGIDDIYCIYDAKKWDIYYGLISQHANELQATDDRLKNDPVIQKDIAEHKKDLKEFAMRQAANKWKV